MPEKWTPAPGHTREQAAIDLTQFVLRKHYWESNAAADESIFDEPLFWFGAAEQEFSVDREAVVSLFRRFVGKVPKCSITDEEFHATRIAPDVYMVAGRFWVATDPATGVFIRFHQRISTCVRWREGKARICMLHLSIPYVEMTEDDLGFPTEMAQQSREYMRQQLEEQKNLLAAATADLEDIYNTVSCGILRLVRREGKHRLLTFNRALAQQVDASEGEVWEMDWSPGFSPYVVPEDVPALSNALASLKEPGDHTTVDYRILTRSGRVLYLSASNKLIRRDGEEEIIQRLIYNISKRVELEKALKRLSFTDLLTGLFNRNRFNLDVEAIQHRGLRRLGVACFDLNGLKEWNDRMGHMAGDALIRRTALLIGNTFPGKAYRIGGDEFVVLDSESEEAAFKETMARVRALLQQEKINISAGACWREGDRCEVLEQYEEADRLMYREKSDYYRNR